MRVCLILERLDPRIGGREAYTCSLVTQLADRGVDVAVICQSAQWSHNGVTVLPLTARGISRHRRLTNFVSDAQRLLAGERFDVVHAMLPMPGADICHSHSGTVPAQYLSSLRRRNMTRLLARLMRGLNFSRRVSGRFERDIARDPRTICLCVSGMVAREFEDHYGRRENVRVIWNGATIPADYPARREEWRQSHRRQIGAGDGQTVFLTVAANLELKGVPQAIEAMAQMAQDQSTPPAMLVVVGGNKPKSIKRCEALAHRRGVGDRVVFLGHRSDIFEWYAAADALVQLSWYDSCSLAILEALGCGVPCIASSFAGASELLSKGGGIIVNSPSDIPDVGAAMRVMTDPLSRAEHAKACRHVAADFTPQRHVEQILKLYREVAVLKNGSNE